MVKRIIKAVAFRVKRWATWILEREQVVKLDIHYVSPSDRFKGHKVLVTGGTSGIGLACAKAFLSEGAEVLICGRNAEALERTAGGISNVRLKTMQWDISEVENIPKKLDEAATIMSRFDIFVNSAGVSAYNGGENEIPVYDYIVNINMRGLFFMCKAQGEYLKANQIPGKIVNITSKAGVRKCFDSYTLSKWGANSLTYGLSRELAPYHINVNGVAPGCVPTNIVKHLQCHMGQENQFYKGHRTQRFTQPEEIAAVVKFLASGEANNIVGQIIEVDGGIFA